MDHDLAPIPCIAELPHQLEAIPMRHLVVGDDDVETVEIGREAMPGRAAIFTVRDPIPFAREQLQHDLADDGVILDAEHARRSFRSL